jgi:hypothetical protein
VPEQAPEGQTFTTYNFEVEQDHTYFVGEAGVWVHNACNPHLSSQENIRSALLTRAKSLNKTIDNLGADRFSALSDAKKTLLGEALSKHSWLPEAKDCCEKMVADCAAGKVALGDVPSVKQWNNFFNRGTGTGKGGHDVHHAVEKWIQRDYLGLASDFDDVPGWIMSSSEHIPRNSPGTLANELKVAVEAAAAGLPNGPDKALRAAEAIKQVYENRQLNDLWEVTRKWLINMQLPTP